MKILGIPLPVLLPVMAGLFIVAWGGGLGVLFIALRETALGKWGAVAGGLLVVALVPTFGVLMSRRSGSKTEEKRP